MAVESRVPEHVFPVSVYIAAAIALTGALLFWYLQRGPRPAAATLPLTPEARAYVGNLKLSGVEPKATKSYLNQMVYEIRGNIANTGNRAVGVVEVFCVFHDAYGQVVLRQRLPIVTARSGGLKPGESKPFRLPFDDLPQSWNQQMPQLVIAAIQFS